jgi:sugar phosphate isomerase/epimerase
MTHFPLRSRRDFIRYTAVAAAALASDSRLSAAPVHGMTVGLSQYSLRALFRDGKLDALDYPAFAKKTFGLTELDVWEGGLPPERIDDARYLAELKRSAAEAGTRLFLLMGGIVDGTGGAGGPRKGKAADHARTIERAAALGCGYVRFFVAAADGERAVVAQRCAEALAPLADRAQAGGLMLAIEPGGSNLTKDGAFLAETMRQLRHAHCRLMPDFGKLAGDVYEGTRAMMPFAAVISAKTHEFDAAGNQVEFDYFRLMRIVAEAGYRGTVAIEWEGKQLDPIQGVLASKRLIERALAAL